MVYNPETTLLMRLAAERGARVCNGLAMLYGQAEENWRVW
jgi:shikimate dehydrogenase